MRAFLKFLDEQVWVSVKRSWTIPSLRVDGVDKSRNIPTWYKDELVECNLNNKGVHAIFKAISYDELKHVSMCETF